MSKCENCIHYKACEDWVDNLLERHIFPYECEGDEKPCEFYKDKSFFVELPCKVGDKVSVRALCESVLTTPCYEECRYICPFENDCECEECSSLNERIFDTKISSIYNNGNGWYIEFEHLIPQARFSDIGTSFFVGETAHAQAEAKQKEIEGK